MKKEIIERISSDNNENIIQAIIYLHKKRKMIWVPEIGKFLKTDSELFLRRVDEFLRELQKLGYLEKRGNLDGFDVYNLKFMENGHSLLDNCIGGKELK